MNTLSVQGTTNRERSLMQTSQRTVLTLMGEKEKKVKYIHKNFKYVKPMTIERLKSTVFLIILYSKELQTLQGMVSVAKFPYMIGVEVGRAYLRKAFYR